MRKWIGHINPYIYIYSYYPIIISISITVNHISWCMKNPEVFGGSTAFTLRSLNIPYGRPVGRRFFVGKAMGKVGDFTRNWDFIWGFPMIFPGFSYMAKFFCRVHRLSSPAGEDSHLKIPWSKCLSLLQVPIQWAYPIWIIYTYIYIYIPVTSRTCIISCLIGKINLSNHSRNSEVCRDFVFSRFAHLLRYWTRDIKRSITITILISRPRWISKVKLRQSFSGSKVAT